ncbi:hypothetical protein GGG16DRAFT_55466 [Schizophyllum commune]
MGGPDSPWRYVDQIVRAIADLVIRCSRPGCPDPFYPNKIAGNRTYRSKRERHCQKFHSTQVTVDYQGDRVTVFRNPETNLFPCPCGSTKHARRNSRRLKSLCRPVQHPSSDVIGTSPDSDDSEYTVDSDEDDQPRSDSTSVISVHDSPKSKKSVKKPLRAAPASRLRQAYQQSLAFSPKRSSTSTLLSSAGPCTSPSEATTTTGIRYPGLQRPRIGRPPAHLTRALAGASASASKLDQTAASSTRTLGKRKRSSSSARTKGIKKPQRDPESSDSEEGLKIEIEKLKKKIRKQKLRGELLDLACELKDLERESGGSTPLPTLLSINDAATGVRMPIFLKNIKLDELLPVETTHSYTHEHSCPKVNCPDPLYPVDNAKYASLDYTSRRKLHCQRFHSLYVTVYFRGQQVTIYRDPRTGVFHCPCGSPKHARRSTRGVRAVCRPSNHPASEDVGPCPDTEEESTADEDDDESTAESSDEDGDTATTDDGSVISVSDDLESSPPPRPPLRAGPASLMRRKNGHFAPRNSGSASTSSTRASANNATVSSVAYVGVQQPRIGRPPAHLLRARAAATASTQKPQSTAASSSQMPRKRKRTSYESPAMSTRAGTKRRLSSDSEEDLKRQVEELEKQLRKHKLRKELRDLAGQLDDLKRASG